MNHAMIDIETLGIGQQVPLFEIGVCIFEPKEKIVGDSYQINVDLLDVIITTGFSTQQGTIDWWRQQEYDPRTMPASAFAEGCSPWVEPCS